MRAVILLCLALGAASLPAQAQEATVAGIHEEFAAGRLTCAELTRRHLDRIDAYDTRGPALRAILTVNPKAMETAAELDRQYRSNPAGAGPLHCIPIVLKDNFNTFDMPTTGGSVALRHSQPPADAFTVAKMRMAGALVLAKTNMTELARGGMSKSSLGGQVLNPYDLTRTPGGSSGGTGAAVAAGFAVLGTGSDTSQSIRSPASATSLVGIRPTRGLVSRSGVMPNSQTQDEVGPIARTVVDAARLLDVMAGYDPDDPITAFGHGHRPASYTHLLRTNALARARIGVMTNLFGTAERHREVNAIMADVTARMETLGATIVRFPLPEYDALESAVATAPFEARTVMDRYLAALGPTAPVRSLAQLVAAKNSVVQAALEVELGIADGMNSSLYRERLASRDRLRLAVAAKMAELKLDAILYPLQKILAVPVTAEEQAERNGALSYGTGFPAVTFPAGFSAPTRTAPLGVPVGAELLGLDYTEDKLLAYAYAFEQAANVRKPPASTPPLPAHSAWPQFRGGLAGIAADDPSLPDTWSATDNVVWKAAVPGRAWSSPIVWGDHIFVTSVVSSTGPDEALKPTGAYVGRSLGGTMTGSDLSVAAAPHRWVLYAVDFNTGKIRWERTFHTSVPASKHQKNSYASETPATDGERVYVYSAQAGLFAFDMGGTPLWSTPMAATKTRSGWGSASSPVVQGTRVYIVNDNDEQSFIAAYDTRTGAEIWRTDRQEGTNWSTPFVWENDRRTEIVTAGTGGVRSYGLDGALLWQLSGMSTIQIPTPFARHGLLYINSGYVADPVRPVYAIRPGASGDISLAAGAAANDFVVWSNTTLGSYNPSSLVYGNYHYTLLDRGILICHDARTGEEIYSRQRITSGVLFTASPWAYNGRIFALSEEGETFVIQAGPEFKLLGTNRLDEMTLATPAVANGSLVVRTASSLYRISRRTGD